jgi:hypothetical protein
MTSKVPRRVFVVWFGSPMNENRLAGLRSIEQTIGVEVVVIDESSLSQWVDPSLPLHPAFEHLTAIQKSDYLRCYLLHVHGGGYADIKPQSGSWIPAFDDLDATPDAYGSGYTEVGRSGVAQFGLTLTRHWELRPLEWRWWRYRWLQLNHRRLIGNGAFVFRPDSRFTRSWFDRLTLAMDRSADALAANPGRFPKERSGEIYDGVKSRYPIHWGAIQADIFHPLCLRHHRRILHGVPTPVFQDYQ